MNSNREHYLSSLAEVAGIQPSQRAVKAPMKRELLRTLGAKQGQQLAQDQYWGGKLSDMKRDLAELRRQQAMERKSFNIALPISVANIGIEGMNILERNKNILEQRRQEESRMAGVNQLINLMNTNSADIIKLLEEENRLFGQSLQDTLKKTRQLR